MSLKHQLVKDDERYRITDFEILDLAGMTISLTELKTGQSTRGHTHASPEIYAFLSDAVIQLGDASFGVSMGQMLVIKADTFHRVFTAGQRPARFISIFWGDRSTLKADYAKLPDQQMMHMPKRWPQNN